MMKLALTIVSLLIISYIAYNFVSQYRASTAATTWDKMLAAGRGSATILFQKASILVSALTIFSDKALDAFGTALNDQAFSDQAKGVVQQWLTPTTVGVGLMIFSAVTILLRLRSLSKVG